MGLPMGMCPDVGTVEQLSNKKRHCSKTIDT